MRIDIHSVATLAIVALAGCAEISSHQFAEPSRDWRVRSGQLMYASPTAKLIGEVVVRFSKNGDFELTFSKGLGVNLIVVREDATFARVEGPLAGGDWMGPIAQAPEQLRGWLQLRDKLVRQDRQPRNNRGSRSRSESIRLVVGTESFRFRF